MDDKRTSCCFTGHRPEKLPWGDNEHDHRCLELKERIAAAIEAAYSGGIRHYICGMAAGCDLYFCESVMAFREEHTDVLIEAAIPWEGQAHSWPKPLKLRYNRLVESCDFFTLVQKRYTPDCFMKRNRYMVDSSSLLITAYGGRAGGTMNTVLYAMRQGLEIIELPILQ